MKSLRLGTKLKREEVFDDLRSFIVMGIRANSEHHFQRLIGHFSLENYKNDYALKNEYLKLIETAASKIRSGQMDIPEIARRFNFLEGDLIEKNFPEIEVDFWGFSNSGKYIDGLIIEFINKNFDRKYKFLWELSLYREGPQWYLFLESQEASLKTQKRIFDFYWTLYKSYSKTRQLALADEAFEPKCSLNLGDHLVEDHEVWLLNKCNTHRLRLTTFQTERDLEGYIDKVWSKFVQINSPLNFIKSNFTYSGLEHSNILYPYSIELKIVASEFLEFLKDEDSIIAEARKTHKTIELQLWIEFLFKGLKGFGKHNVQEFFVEN